MKLVNIFHNRDKVQSALLIALILSSSLLAIVPLAIAGTPPVASDGGEYQAEYGVLHSDTYLLYPYESKSLDIGFSKYGEMINPEAGVGLAYDGVDAFASSVPENKWSSGWVIDIHYIEQGCLQNVWAYALYTDWNGPEGIGGSWRQMQKSVDASADGDSHGGRRTSGWAITDDIRVIYDGPRKAIYLLNTTIYDKNPEYEGTPMVEITIQLVFNKVKKYVEEIKDIKRIDNDKWHSPFQIEFSQRGEWDIGNSITPRSYAEFYNGLVTKYYKHPFYYPEGEEEVTYDLCQMINEDESLVGYAAYWPNVISKWVEGTDTLSREEVLTSMETTMEEIMVPENELNITGITIIPGEYMDVEIDYTAVAYPRGSGEWSDEPWVFKKDGDCWMQLKPDEWEWMGDKVRIYEPLYDPYDEFAILYKKHVMGAVENHPTPCKDMPMDVFAEPPETTYGMYAEPRVPYVFAEWDFDLDYDNVECSTHQFRCVSVYGLTDNHNALDPDMPEQGGEGAPGNMYCIDEEVLYQLDEVFNPYDLSDAAHKDSFRWVQKGTLPEIPDDPPMINLTSHLKDMYGNDRLCLDGVHRIIRPIHWGEYCSDSENVLLLDDDGVMPPLLLTRPEQYELTIDGKIMLIAAEIDDYDDYEYYKILYSTEYICQKDDSDPSEELDGCCWSTGRWEWTVIGKESLAPDSTGTALVSTGWHDWKNKQVWMSGIDYKDEMFAPNHPYLMERFSDMYGGKHDYHFDHMGGDHRTALRDDWCTPDNWEGEEINPYAISSGNIIVVGGPINNLAAEYFNDFTDAFLYSTYGQGFYAPGCWARTTQPSLASLEHQEVPLDEWPKDELWYSSPTTDDDVGYAIVSTYKDINGTVGFIVYGYTADDTYYTCYALRGGLIAWMQTLQPGVTTILLEINYEDIHPVSFHVKECLGGFTECTGFCTNFKDEDYDENYENAYMNVMDEACYRGLCYKLVDVDWCAQVHPDP